MKEGIKWEERRKEEAMRDKVTIRNKLLLLLYTDTVLLNVMFRKRECSKRSEEGNIGMRGLPVGNLDCRISSVP